ncbi:hypothetical protein IWQ60_011280 [Tieghemiomyces parasiticus]|uniref:Uncharacterized protein n=1 Tax=Tieghemiomyces parasiticus TaxID=78921 RepID=A0A9W7ZQU3_9FUNG|nr:hypothetical protein IWQ60_011280 [Tieghemiomyces parasiticus]
MPSCKINHKTYRITTDDSNQIHFKLVGDVENEAKKAVLDYCTRTNLPRTYVNLIQSPPLSPERKKFVRIQSLLKLGNKQDKNTDAVARRVKEIEDWNISVVIKSKYEL